MPTRLRIHNHRTEITFSVVLVLNFARTYEIYSTQTCAQTFGRQCKIVPARLFKREVENRFDHRMIHRSLNNARECCARSKIRGRIQSNLILIDSNINRDAPQIRVPEK